MPKYSGLEDYSKNWTPSEKLAALRSEMIGLLSTMRGYAAVMQAQLDKGTVINIPQEWEGYIDKIVEAGNDARELLEMLTVTPNENSN